MPFEWSYFKHWGPYLKTAIPIGSLLWLEWLCYEFYSLQASFMNDAYMGANVIMSNFASLYYQFAYGISIAATTYVGGKMGSKDPKTAKKYHNTNQQ
jgi:MATE family multidrug resistance protein